MRVLIAKAYEDHIDLHKAQCSPGGFKIEKTANLYLDYRFKAPRRHLMKRVTNWINLQGDSGTKVIILVGDELTELLIRKVEEQTLCKVTKSPLKDPVLALAKLSQTPRKI